MPEVLSPNDGATAILRAWASLHFDSDWQIQATALMQKRLIEHAARQAAGGPT